MVDQARAHSSIEVLQHSLLLDAETAPILKGFVTMPMLFHPFRIKPNWKIGAFDHNFIEVEIGNTPTYPVECRCNHLAQPEQLFCVECLPKGRLT